MQSEIAHEAANWVVRTASAQSLITVTRALLSSRGDHVTIYVSVFPEEQGRTALAFLNRSKGDFAEHLKKHARIAPLPSLAFTLEPTLPNLSGGPSGN